MKYQMAFLFAILCGAGQAQQPVGSVGVQDATVAGNLSVTNGRVILVGNTTVTAKDHVAEVALSRGGSVRVCATSGLNITAGKSIAGTLPLMLSLDRGAIEVRMAATTSDVIMTPDLRFGVHTNGPLDLRLRVTSGGDTCVENRGGNAPTLTIADQFGESSYDLRAGQHVLFEHGSLKEVVDHESSPCGCPPAPVVSVADAGATSAGPAVVSSTVAAKSAEEQHPFPAAVSDGLAPVAQVPQAPAGVVHAQVATTLSYDAGADRNVTGSEPAAPQAGAPGIGSPAVADEAQTTPASTASAETAKAPAPEPPHDAVHWIGHFFKRLFGRG